MADEPTTDANPADQAYGDARRLAQEGDYAAALERHEWFHACALAHKPSLYGVRLSFALSAWVELGQKYPPALKSLKRIRDRDSDRLRAGLISDSVFHDVVAINRVLKEDAQTMMLFRKIEGANPEAAQRLFRFMISEALDVAPDLFLRYTPDLMGHYRWMSQQHRDMRLRIASCIVRALPAPRISNVCADQLIKFDSGFLESVQQLAQLARNADQPELATRMLAAAETLIQELQSAKAPESPKGVDARA